MIERGKHYESYKSKNEERRDEFLSRSLLRHGSDVHAALNELSVAQEKIDAQRLRGHLKHGYEDPRLPIVERTCRNEQAREQNCERYQVRQYAPDVKICHQCLSRRQLTRLTGAPRSFHSLRAVPAAALLSIQLRASQVALPAAPQTL